MSDQEHTTAECLVCPILRKRLHDVEEAAEHYILVITETGALRQAAHEKMVAALTVSFRTAILTSHDMTPEQRAYWLAESDKHEAARPAPTGDGDER